MVILESTGHYHSPVVQYLDEHEVLYILLNPIISYQAKKSSLRKVKTDAIDAYQLCVLYYKEDFAPHKSRGIQLLNLRNLSRQQEIVTNMYVEAKLRLRFSWNFRSNFQSYTKLHYVQILFQKR
jgi:transposase